MDNKNKSTLLKDALILFAITLIASLLLGLVYEITKDPILEQQAKAKTDAYKKVFSSLAETKSDPDLDAKVAASEELILAGGINKVFVNEALLALDASGNPLGYVMSVTSKNGYGGAITFAMGYNFDGTMTGIAFLAISETAGLGMEAKKDWFTDQFKDVKTSSFGLAKSKIAGDVEVDCISSATITTRAVTLGVNGGLIFAADAIQAGIGGASK